MSNLLISLLLASLALIAFIGPGQLLARLLRISFQDRVEEGLFGLALGLGLVETLLYILGLLHAIGPLTAWLILLIGLLVTYLVNRAILTDSLQSARLLQAASSWRWSWDPLLLVPLFAVLALLASRITTIGVPALDGDSTSTYLAFAKEWAQIGYIRFENFGPRSVFAYSPLNGIMLWMFGFLLGGSVRGEGINQALHYLLGCGTLVLIFRLAMRIDRTAAGRRLGLLAAAAFYSMPVMSFIAGSVRPDLSWAYVDIAGLVALLSWFQSEELNRRRLLLSGLCLGFALASRWTPFASVVGASALVLARLNWRRIRWQQSILGLLCLLGPVFLIAGHYFLRNWLVSGNLLHNAASGWTFGYNPGFDLLRVPLDAALLTFWASFRITPVGIGCDTQPFGPFAIMFLLLLVAVPRRPRGVWALLTYSVISLIVWFLSGVSSYMVLTAWAALFVAVGYGLVNIFYVSRRAQAVALGALALLLAVQVARDWRLVFSFDRIPVLSGQVSRTEYLEKYLSRPGTDIPNWRLIQIIDELPPGTRVLMVPGHVPYFFARPLVTVPLGADWLDQEEVLRFMEREAVTHVWVNTGSALAQKWGVTKTVFGQPDFIQSHFRLLAAVDGQFLYEYRTVR